MRVNMVMAMCLSTMVVVGSHGGPFKAGVDEDEVEGGTKVAVLGLIIAVEGGGGFAWDCCGCQL